LDETRAGTAGKKGPSGLIDYRGNNAEHPVLCVDGKKATFLDDAFSISPETGEVLVHIVDVVGTLRRHELLQQTARERISSTYLPSGSLHMLPPQALESLKLSTKGPNEVYLYMYNFLH
jgi:exoribonuclease R